MVQQRVILSIKDLEVKFRVRNRVLTAIRDISFDIYDGEIIAIVGESGSGKSVLTKTFTNMIESNGYISKGSINYYPSEASKQSKNDEIHKNVDLVDFHRAALDRETVKKIVQYNNEEIKRLGKEIKLVETFNEAQANTQLIPLNEELNVLQAQVGVEAQKRLNKKIAKVNRQIKTIETHIAQANDSTYLVELNNQLNALKEENTHFQRVSLKKRRQIDHGIDLLTNYLHGNVEKLALQNYFDEVLMPLEYRNNTENDLYDTYFSVLNDKKYQLTQEELDFLQEGWKEEQRNRFVSKFTSQKNLHSLRGATIATIFQDPMTSLNPLLSVGYQVIAAIKNNNKVSHSQARKEAIELLKKVGIPNAEKRMRDLPGKYSGGMRQRVVIAIALACKPKILICDEPTTALDVTIQAQILTLIKDLKKEYGFTVVFITHDLGVVANIADRVAIVYAGQIIEYGTTDDIFFHSRHPYTWALLMSLPQLGKKGHDLFSLQGTPPSLFNKIQGDAFAPRNKYALEIDYLYEPPMFKISNSHHAKTWLLDTRAPKVKRPKELDHLRQAISEAKVGD